MLLFFLFLVTTSRAFVPSTKVYSHQRTATIVAADLDPSLIPLVAAGAVSVIGIGAAVTLGGSKKSSSPAAPPAPVAPPTPPPNKVPETPSPSPIDAAAEAPVVASASTTEALVKACWSGDSFGGYSWPSAEKEKGEESSPVSTIDAWREACSKKGATSYWDFGVRVIEWAPPSTAPSKSVTSADWRAACDSSGVVSYYDFGLRLA